MKVLGYTGDNYNRKYLVEISLDEINCVLDKGYNDKSRVEKLAVGETLDLGSAPNQRDQIVAAVKKMQEGHTAFLKASACMAEVARVIGAESMAASERGAS